jgi:hypothetical protein
VVSADITKYFCEITPGSERENDRSFEGQDLENRLIEHERNEGGTRQTTRGPEMGVNPGVPRPDVLGPDPTLATYFRFDGRHSGAGTGLPPMLLLVTSPPRCWLQTLTISYPILAFGQEESCSYNHYLHLVLYLSH